MKKVLAFTLLNLIVVLFYAQSSTTDSVPTILHKPLIVQKELINKYQFQKIGITQSKKTISAIDAYYSQPAVSNNLSYNLNVEALEYIAQFRKKNEAELRNMKSSGAYYLSNMESILMQQGIPKQMVYLAVIETHLNVNLVSWAGAAGMWQFMPETGRSYGLQIGNGYDERFNWTKSTVAAAGYLRYLYRQFNDWLLVVAAYNGGPGRVYSAIKRSGSHNFWELQNFLPKESSNHVKKFIATQYIMEGSTAIAVMNPAVANKKELQQKYFNPLQKGAVAVDTTKGMITEVISGRYNSLIIAKYIMLDIATFNIINPNFDEALSKNESTFGLRLPNDKMQLFKEHKLKIMNESLYLFLTLNGAQPAYEPKVTKQKK